MCKVYQKKHLNLWLTCFLFIEIIYSLLQRLEYTKVDIESCKSRDGQYSGQKKKGKNKTKNDLQNTTQKTKIEQHEPH
jgi:hypothetical protein